jgi:hypothetical protein
MEMTLTSKGKKKRIAFHGEENENLKKVTMYIQSQRQMLKLFNRSLI